MVTARYTFQAFIQEEKDVIFIAGRTEISPLEEGNWPVNELGRSGSELLENMALGNRVEKDTGGKDHCVNS